MGSQSTGQSFAVSPGSHTSSPQTGSMTAESGSVPLSGGTLLLLLLRFPSGTFPSG
jgi:hypothetical protein